ncbi:receptor-type guanylate cyclase Gyc76C-like, partial [Nilaparvata lugens]|uniref:receptor-type guanylate cyclase Gyc76C-like n=1 Tax=Nilaparvata lugens TaxID=108931 RepID=UPI00193CFDD5
MVAVATRPDKMAMYKVAPNVGPFDHKSAPNVGPFDHKLATNVGPFDHNMAPNVGPLDQKMGPSDPNITIIDNLDTTPVNTTKVSPNTKRQPIDLTVGYLTAIKGDVKDRQGLAVSGALTMALKEVNDSPDLLPDVRLVLRWNDTKGDTVQTTRAMTDMICDGVAAFFGPEASCYVEAIISHARNIPMISY